MAREPELSIKVKVDPQIDAAKLQEDINKKIPKDGVEIKGKLNAKELLKSISTYQEGDQNLIPLLAKISNVDEALKAFEKTETKVSLKATQASLDTIRDQLQGVIDGLDYSKLEGASASTSTTSTKRAKKGKKTTAVDTSTTAKQEIPVDVVGTISDDSVTALKTKIEAGLNDVAIVANIAPDQLSKIRKDVEAAFNGIAITPTVKGVNGAAAQTGAKKKVNIPSDDKIMEQMANAQYTATKNENAEAAAVKQKDIIYQNLADHQAKASENASAATAKTAQGLSDANKAMGDLNASAVDFEQDWRRVVTLIASATKNLANLMNSYKESSGLDVFSSFQEFQEELPDLDTEHVKPYLKSIKDWSDSLLGSAKGDFDSNTMIQAIHMLSGLADAWNNIDVSKLTDNKTKDKLLKEMSELNSIFPSSGDKQPFLGEKDAAINYLTDLLAKAAKYYAEVGNAAKQTADSIAVANEGFANQTAELEKNNAELEKLKQNGVTPVKESAVDTPSIAEKVALKPEDITPPETPVEIPGHITLTETDITVPDKAIEIKVKTSISDTELEASVDKPEQTTLDSSAKDAIPVQQLPLPETPNFTKPSETLEDYRDSLGAAAGIQQYFAGEVDNANASLGKQTEQLNATKKSLDDYYASLSNGTNPIDVTLNIKQQSIDSIRAKIEQALNQITFTQQPQTPSSNNKGKGSGRSKQTSAERELARNLVEQAQIENKLDSSNKNKHYRNANVQRSRGEDLRIQEENIRKTISKNNQNYQNEDWYNKATLKADYTRDNYTSLQADKEDLDIVVKLNAELDKNVQLRKDLSRISKTQTPQAYADKDREVKKSNYQVTKLGQQAHKQGVYLGNIRKDHVDQIKEIEEEAKNKLFETYGNELKQYISTGYRRVDANNNNNYEKSTRLWNEQNNHKTNLDNLTKEMYARGYNKYDQQDTSGTYQRFIKLTQSRTSAENELALAIKEKTAAQKEESEVDNSDITRLAKITAQLERQKHTLEGSDEGRSSSTYGSVTKTAVQANNLTNELNTHQGSNKDLVARLWAQKNNISGINSLADAYEHIKKEVSLASIEVEKFSDENTKLNKQLQNQVRISNMQSQLHDYLEKCPKVAQKMAEEVQKLQDGLASSDAGDNVKELSLQMAELRSNAKKAGLESQNLLDIFEKLFGQHLSTMVTMAALHKMQDALRIVYQNVVEIDTAVTELRKVSEYAGKSLEEYMGRASEQAQKLGVSISDYVNSTADWKRLGYSDEDAENMATYSTLLKNVGDGIDDVNTSSSYLISTMQGFGLLADQAEDVVNKIDAVANTQPVTAKDLGEILTRSSAAMSAANNTLEETIALGTAANAVIQDADTVGTTLKSLSMYLRAAKSDAENAGIEVDGMANSVSELRSELKSLTGVDIMLDSKNFKSTYQIMKELSQVWSGLSDVTQANVTEMIGGKRNANAVSAILNNFDVAESSMESAANSANVAWEENDEWLNSIQGRLNQLDASFQALSTDVLDSDLVKTVVSLATGLTKAADAMIKFTGAIPMSAGIATFITQLGKPKMTGFTIVPSNTPGGDTEQACCAYYIKCRSAREYLVKPTNMAA